MKSSTNLFICSILYQFFFQGSVDSQLWVRLGVVLVAVVGAVLGAAVMLLGCTDTQFAAPLPVRKITRGVSLPLQHSGWPSYHDTFLWWLLSFWSLVCIVIFFGIVDRKNNASFLHCNALIWNRYPHALWYLLYLHLLFITCVCLFVLLH